MTTAAVQDIVPLVAAKKIRVVSWSIWTTLTLDLEWLSAAVVLVQAIGLTPRVRHGDTFLPGYWIETGVGAPLRWRQTQTGSPGIIRGVLEYIEV